MASVHGRHIKAKKGTGRAQFAAATPNQQYALAKYYTGKVFPTHIARQEFRFTALLRQNQKTMPLTNYVNQMQWQELGQQAWMQGEMTLRTVSMAREHLQIAHGDVVMAEVLWDGRWEPLWDMRIWDPDRTLSAGDPQFSCALYDDLYLLSLSQDDFHFRNLFCHEILMRVFERYKVPTGKIAMGTYRIPHFNQSGISPLDAVIAAYQMERKHTGRRFIMRWAGGKANVLPLVRNDLLYVMHQQLVDATVHHVTPSNFATSLTGRASITNRKTGKVHKLSATATQNVPAYGMVHAIQDYSQNYDQRQLDKAVANDLVSRQILGLTVDFDHPGIAKIHKGDAISVYVPEEGFSGAKSIVWVTDIQHDLTPGGIGGGYTMTPTVAASDPVGLPNVVLKQRNKNQRALKRKQRKRGQKKAKTSKPGSPAIPTPSALQKILDATGAAQAR